MTELILILYHWLKSTLHSHDVFFFFPSVASRTAHCGVNVSLGSFSLGWFLSCFSLPDLWGFWGVLESILQNVCLSIRICLMFFLMVSPGLMGFWKKIAGMKCPAHYIVSSCQGDFLWPWVTVDVDLDHLAGMVDVDLSHLAGMVSASLSTAELFFFSQRFMLYSLQRVAVRIPHI